MKKTLQVAVAAVIVSLTPLARSQPETPAGGPPPPPPARVIPGLTAADPHPNGCVDCHVDMKEAGLDVRISTLMEKWQKGVEPKLLAAAKAASAEPTKITGKHPRVSAAGLAIPRGCMACHGPSAPAAPRFARMLHLLHLSGGDTNLYMGYYQGDCTHCHKLDLKTGAWALPSAKEPASK